MTDSSSAPSSDPDSESDSASDSASGPGRLWGPETDKAIDNFRISGRPMPHGVIAWLGRIKADAARVNAELGLVDRDVAAEIAAAGDAIGDGEHADQFPIDVFQTGSGTSTNINVNEVISALTGGRADPYDEVNRGQSSNDIIPTAIHLAALDAVHAALLPGLDTLIEALDEKATEFADVVKPGRTHLMDAVPVTLGAEFGGHAAQLRAGRRHLTATVGHLGELPLGGTAVGTGLNAHPQFAAAVRERLAARVPWGQLLRAPDDRFAAQGARDALVMVSGAMTVLATSLSKIANDLRLMASGPRTGLGEIRLPELQKGSSIMPGKVNPVLCEVAMQVGAQVLGNHATVATANMQGNFELNTMMPVMAKNVLESIELLGAACRSLGDDCVRGVVADRERCRSLAELSLANATALAPALGYELVERIVRRAVERGESIRAAALAHDVDSVVLDDALDLPRMAHGRPPSAGDGEPA